MDPNVVTALIAGGASILGAGAGLTTGVVAQRGQTKIARAQLDAQRLQLEAQKEDAQRDDAHRLVELANQLGGTWIDRLAGEVNSLRDQLHTAESQIRELTAEVRRLTDQVRDRDELRAQLAAVIAERDQLLVDIAALSAGSEARP